MTPVVHRAGHMVTVSHNQPGAFNEWVHEQHVVSIHLKTAGRYIVGKEAFELSGPIIGVLPRGERDCNGLVGQMEYYYCKFDWDGIASETGEQVTLRQHGASLHRSHLRRLAQAEIKPGVELFRDLIGLSRRPDLSSQLRAGARVLDLLALWAEPAPQARGQERAVRIYRGLIEQYVDDPAISLNGLAERVGMSSDHLGVLFHREMGMTPVEYRTRLRLLRARELLVSTAKSVREIAREVGFPNAPYFTRLFRRTFGLSPLEYARSQAYAFPERAP